MANSNDAAEQALKKLLSIRGIFVVYNFDEIRKSLPFKVSILCTLIYVCISFLFNLSQLEVLSYLKDKFISIFPNLLGFSLGGYAIIVGFGNTDFLERIAKSTNGTFSIYEKLNSIFAFNLLCQIFVLGFSILCDFSLFLDTKIHFIINYNTIQALNGIASTILIFMSIWTITVIPYLVTNIFIFGEAHHITLKK